MRETRPASEDAALADGHHLARGAAANTLVLIAANFRGVFTFLVARLLGKAALGRFGLAFVFTELLSKIGTLGFDSGIVPVLAPRAAAGEGDACRATYRRAIALAVTASSVLIGASIALAPKLLALFHGESLLDALSRGGYLMWFALPAIAVARISHGAARAMLSMRNEFYSRGIAETWVTTGVFLAAFAFGVRDYAPALAVVCGLSASAIVAFTLATRSLNTLPASGGHHPVTPSFRHPMTELFRISLPTAGTNLLNTLVTQADVILLFFYVGHAPGVTLESFGVFVVAAELAVGLRKVRQIFDPIFAPIVATRAASEHRAALKDTVAGPGRWVVSAQLPIVGVLLLSSGAVMSIYGEGFREGALWLALLALAHGTNTFAGLVETLLMIERPGINLANAAVTVAVQLVAGVVLIPRYGVTGAAVAMCLGFGVQSVLRFVELRSVYGWTWPWRSLVRPLVAFAIAFMPALAMRWLPVPGMEIASGLVFLGLYALTWWKLGAEPSDREIWKRLVASKRSSR